MQSAEAIDLFLVFTADLLFLAHLLLLLARELQLSVRLHPSSEKILTIRLDNILVASDDNEIVIVDGHV